MSFFTHMLTQSVDVESITLDQDGSETVSSTTTGVDARVERSIEGQTSDRGTARDTVTTVWLDQEVAEGDRIVLPSGDTMQVARTESIPAVDGRVELYKAEG